MVVGGALVLCKLVLTLARRQDIFCIMEVQRLAWGFMSMSKDVVQKEFQNGLFRFISFFGFLTVCIAGFWFWQGAVLNERAAQSQPPVIAPPPVTMDGAMDVSYAENINRSIRASDMYLVAAHNLAEGTVLTKADLKVVKMPGLQAYELAFFSPEAVLGMSTSHAIPEGQPVLPYHVEAALKDRKYCKTDSSQ